MVMLQSGRIHLALLRPPRLMDELPHYPFRRGRTTDIARAYKKKFCHGAFFSIYENHAYHAQKSLSLNSKIKAAMNVRLLFTLTILLSAFLLFLIQPMLSKIILPRLGGSPAVWQTAMMFYQTLLLGGYIYAHASTRWLGTRRQSRFHIAFLLVSCICLPISLHVTTLFDPSTEPVRYLLVTLFLTIGLPFFILSANAPLIQHWYACHAHTASRNPYTLYSASNFGSFTALLSYPFLIEPWITLSGQTTVWSVLYAVFALLLIVCVAQLGRHFAAERPMEGETQEALEEARTPTTGQKIHWVALAFVPSSLMLGVTTHITTDIAAVPLLWVVPLALYLLTFVLAFHPAMPTYRFFVKEQVFIVAILLIAKATRLEMLTPFQLIHFLAFFAIAMLCHGQLALARPKARHLTGFYVWVSVGGALGGIFNALIAPQIFTSTMEYWLILSLACFLRPQTEEFRREFLQRLADFAAPLLLGGIFIAQYYLAPWLIHQFTPTGDTPHALFTNLFPTPLLVDNSFLMLLTTLAACILLPGLCQHRPVRFGYCVLVIFMVIPFTQSDEQEVKILHRERNFFGISIVKSQEDPPAHIFTHGTTLHGIQSLDEKYRLHLASYYLHVQNIFNHLPDEVRLKPVAIGGLGAGTLACLGHEQQEFDFYEIDAAVKAIAENPALFTYLRDCPTRSTVQVIDARMGIAATKDARYGAIFMDAYSSDSLPMHLMTREALAIYLQKLAPNGILAFHISNRYLRLAPILANLAADAGLVAITKTAHSDEPNVVPAEWVIMARTNADLDATGYAEDGWSALTSDGSPPWTDDYSNIWEALR